MATADEILAAEFGLEDIWFEVDLLSRQIVIPKAVTNLGVKSDADVMHVRFRLPRFYYGVDFSEFKIGIDYTNAEGEEDRYEPEDVSIDDNAVIFTWIVGRHAALYNGNVTFGLCAKKLNPDDPDDPFNEFHTTKASLPILDGVETCEEAIVMHTDLLEQWREQLFGERDSLLSQIAGFTDAMMAAIDTKAARTLETIPEDYTETYRLAHDSVRTRANAIVCSSEGEVVDIRDASDDYLRGLRIFGKTTQLKTTGAQLFDCSKLTDLSGQGITMNNDGTGRITVDGKSTSAASSVNIAITGLTPGTYYVSGEIPGKMFFYVRYTNAEGQYEYIKAPGSFTLDGTETDFLGYLYAPTAGVTFSKDVIYPMLNAGSVPLPWEPYTGGVPSPSPDCPQSLKYVYQPTVYTRGKNLLNLPQVINKTSTLYNYDLYTGQNGAGQKIPESYFLSLPVLKAGVSYYYSYDIEGDNTNQIVFLQKVDPDGTTNMTGVLLERPGVVCVDEDTMVTLRANSNTVYTIKNLQLEIGTERTAYERFKSLPGMTCSNITLHGVPVESGGNYVDSNDQQWICDELDLERGVYVQRIGTVILTGEETIEQQFNPYSTNEMVWLITPIIDDILQYEAPGYCSHFKYNTEPKLTATEDLTVCVQYNGENSRRLQFRCSEWDASTTVHSWLAAHYDAGTPVTVTTLLETPIEHPLSQSIIKAFNAMRTIFPITNVLNNAGAWMEVKYNADTKTFLENYGASDEKIENAVNKYLEENPVSGGDADQRGLTTAQIAALDGMFKVCAFTKADVSAEYNAFKTAFGIGGNVEPEEPDDPEVTLIGISATYSGGDVAVGTTVTTLTGIVVTAHYSDGTSKTVTGYTLSGTIAEGSNTVTVSYGGKTTTFEVTGVAESGGEDAVQYGLYFPAAYVPTLVFGGEDIVGTHQINKVELTVDLPTQTAGNKIILSSFLSNGGWFGFTKNTEWVTPLGGTTTPNAPSAVLGQGKKTITINFTPAEPSNWGKISLGWGSGNVGNPEFTFYEMKCYMNDVLMADFKPTATLGEIYESVKGVTRNTSSTEGLRLVEVAE